MVGLQIHFVGTEQRMEWETVPKAGYPIHAIPAVSLQRRLLSVSNLALPFRYALESKATITMIGVHLSVVSIHW